MVRCHEKTLYFKSKYIEVTKFAEAVVPNVQNPLFFFFFSFFIPTKLALKGK